MARLHQFCNLGSVKLQVTIQFSCFLKGCVSDDDLFWLDGSDPRALLLTPITWGGVNLESGSRGGL